MRKSLLVVIILIVVPGLSLAAGAYAQTTAPTAAGQPAARAKVIFYYGRPTPLQGCLDQVGILIDGVNVHEIGKWHVWQAEVTPGSHTFMDDTHKDSRGETGSFAAGQTYYYEMIFRLTFGFLPTCDRYYYKFEPMRSNSRDFHRAVDLIGKPGVDETTLASAPAAEPAKPVTVKLAVASTPEAADIEVDGSFMGNTPSSIELAPGEHTVLVSKSGYKPWERKIKLAPGDIRLNAELESDPPKQ